MKTLLLPLLLPALVLFAACGDDDDEDTTPTAGATRTTSATETPDEEPTASATPDPLATVCAENPDPGTDEVVQVDEPQTGDEVASPLAVRGRVAAFEAVFQITIFDAGGDVLGELVGMASEGQTLAPFEEVVSFTVTEDTPACLWVYEESARDGSPIHVLQIPVLLTP